MLGPILLAMMVVTPTDQTVQVSKGTKLEVNNFAGDVNVKVWDKDAVRVEVNHSDREAVDIKQGEQTLTVRSRSVRGGPPRSLDYAITVPKWMAISVSGTYADVTLDGVGGDVAIETTRGDIKVSGGSGFVTLKSVQGEITLEKAKGRIEVRAVNEGIHLADISGDLSAESTNGSIVLDRIDSGNVDLYTVNGNVSYDGPIKDKGLYRLTTHNGLIAMPVAEKANVTLMVRTYNGGFRSTFQLPAESTNDVTRNGKRFTLTLGNGSAHVELESFGGTIALRRPNEPRPETERKRRAGDKGPKGDKDKDKEKGDIGRAIDEALREAGPAIDQAISEAMAELHSAIPRLIPAPTPMPLPRPDLQPPAAPRPFPADRIPQIRRNRGERFQNEPPLAEARMRHGQARLVQHGVAQQNQIEIQRARRVHVRPRAAALQLERLQRLQNCPSRERRVADKRGIQVHRLRAGDAHGDRVVVPGNVDVGEEGTKLRDGVVEVGAPIADVAAESDRYSIHREGSTSPSDGPTCAPRRPSRSCRPASACSKKRRCSRVSPRITRSILAWRALIMPSTRGRHRSTKRCASCASSSNTACAAAAAFPFAARVGSAASATVPPSSSIALATQVSCASSRLMTYW